MNAVVIGGSRGIGLALSRKLKSQGSEVYILARTPGDIKPHEGFNFVAYDATKDELPEGLPDMMDQFAYCPGTINLKPFRSLKIEQFQNDYEVNVIGAVRSLKSCFKALKKSESASVVFFSTVAVGQGMAFHSSIAAAKGALEGMTRSLAAEWAPKIRVNAIAPSLTDTSLAEKLLSTEEKRNAGAQRHPLRQIGKPEDIANMAAYLLGEDASWISGQVIGVDGGMSSLRV